MITARDSDILDTLCRKVRLLTPAQAACGWWPEQRDARQTAQRRLRRLAVEGWLVELKLVSRPLLDLNEPCYCWTPGDAPPPFGQWASRLESRWREPATMLTAFAPTLATLRRRGSPDRRLIKCLGQVTHDLHVSQIYLFYLRTRPELARHWLGEDVFATRSVHQVQPDALIVGEDGAPLRAVEFGGRYPAERLTKFHEDCSSRALPYEVW